MADSIVSAFVDKLGPLIVREAVFLRGVEDQLMLLRNELEWIRSFLREAQRRRKESDLIEVWVTQSIGLAYDAEDVVDAYILHVQLQRRKNFIQKILRSGKVVYSLHQLGNRIEQINTRAQRIAACRVSYDLDVSRSTQESVSEDMVYRKGIYTLIESDVVGFEEEKRRLVRQLKDGETSTSRRVVSILGMGGLGKTSLARIVFNEVSNHFKKRVWISVSQKYDARDLLVAALRNLIGGSGDSAKMDYEQVREELFEELKCKRYLVVIDGIWKVEAWEKLILAFPDGEYGSRIMLTTRNKEVALRATSKDHLLELRLLRRDEGWKLFCRKVFAGVCPPHLMKVGEDIVDKCAGLPLAIVVIGGLLMGKEGTVSAWSKVRDNTKWQLSQDSNQCRETLMYSYNDLPHYLKSCFLYLGLFPEDYEIDAKRLILLWVAEGFVKEQGADQNMEDVAEDYLEELIQRSMIQVAKRMYLDGPVLYCRIHDLLRDLAVSESRKDKFMDFHASNKRYSTSTHGMLRRFAIHSTKSDEHEDQIYHTVTTTDLNLRTLFLFQSHESPLTKPKSISCQGTRMLRVLDMDHVRFGAALPKEIGNLFFLHYLRLCNYEMKSLPNTIGKLVNLQTLDLLKTSLKTLPPTIWQLKNLRHMYLTSYCKMSRCVAKLCRLNDFGRNLLTLHVRNDVLIKMSEFLVKVGHLRSLTVICQNDNGSTSNCFPSSLVDLTLWRYVFGEHSSSEFGSLPKLKSLNLSLAVFHENDNGEGQMVFSREDFSQLEFLELRYFKQLTEWRVEDGGLSSLRDLKIHSCISLKKLPDGLKSITTLRKITINLVLRFSCPVFTYIFTLDCRNITPWLITAMKIEVVQCFTGRDGKSICCSVAAGWVHW